MFLGMEKKTFVIMIVFIIGAMLMLTAVDILTGVKKPFILALIDLPNILGTNS